MVDTPQNTPPYDTVDEVPAEDAIAEDAIALSVLDAVEQLIQERAALEQFAEEKYLRLTQLRDQLRAQNATAENNFRKQIATLRDERDTALAEAADLTDEVRRARLNEQLANDELTQIRQQTEQQRRQNTELQRLLDVLHEEVARQAREHQAEADRYAQLAGEHAELAREHAELKEVMHGLAQAEAERQEQETLRKERERSQSSSSGRLTAVIRTSTNSGRLTGVVPPTTGSGAYPAVVPPSNPNISIGAGDQRFLNFTCKHCGAPLQAKEHLAGLITRCSNCSKMAPVPKP